MARKFYSGVDDYEYRSQAEADFGKFLWTNHIEYGFEDFEITYNKRGRGRCSDCGSKSIYTEHTYTPDFSVFDANTKCPIFIEFKGYFKARDRTKAVAVKKCNNDLELLFVFQADNWLSTKHKNKYSDWCRQKGIHFCLKEPSKQFMDRLRRVK